MTRQYDLKQRVRQRMQKTGERYVAARAHLLASIAVAPPPLDPSLSGPAARYPFAPGICRDTTAARNFLAAIGAGAPHTRAPIDEALLTGLCGGIGFLYIVFEYAGYPPLLSLLMRHDSAADQFVPAGLRRLGLSLQTRETSSAAKAESDLRAALADGEPALCVVDAALIASNPPPGLTPGMAPTIVAVVELAGDECVIDAGRGRPLRIAAAQLARARAAIRKARHRLLTATAADTPAASPTRVDDAIAACVDRFVNSPYKGYASNFGFAGMEKWLALLTDERDAKGWPRLFPDGRRACLGLRRVYEGLQCELTPPAGGRALYAEFLRQAAAICEHEPYARVATAYDEAARAWAAIAQRVADCGVREVRSGCDLLDAYSELLDSADDAAERDVAAELNESDALCALDADTTRTLYRELAGMLRIAIDAERAAHAGLSAALAARRA